MKKTGGLTAILVALAVLALSSSVKAETLTATVPLTTEAEINPSPAPPAGAKGTTYLTVNITRDSQGNITGAVVNFLTSFSFPSGVTITGHHIHEAPATLNGPIVINPSLSGSVVDFPSGVGWINLTAIVTDKALLTRFVANPAGFYVNLHTSVNPGGAMRGQITKLVETLALSVEMNTQEEFPAPNLTNENGIGTGTITIIVRRNALGEVIGGTVTFTVNFNFNGEVRFTGLHIHEGPKGAPAGVVINTGLSANNQFVSTTGKGTINIPVEINATSLPAFRRLLLNPPGFYVNIHTVNNGGGVIRGQLTNFTVPPQLQLASSYVLPAGGLLSTLTFSGSGLDAGTVILINDQLAMTGYDPVTGQLSATVPASLQANPGTLFVQARTNGGLRSLPIALVVAQQANINTVAATTVDAARFGPTVSPEGIAAVFGTSFASQTLRGTTVPLPTNLDGTSAYVNGVLAGQFFVSPNQVNLLVPPGTLPGTATVVIVAKDGKVSQGTVNVAPTAVAIFTSNSTGTGAAAAMASTNGTNFNIFVGNPDGSTNPLDAGSFVMLFGTNFRFASALPSISLGGTPVTPSFSGAHPTFLGLDQANFQIPLSLAGRGEVDLIMTVDGKASNTVKVRIK
jgi:uncharacterized protein (TIGR03437 family)